jgi:hypothetical protein
MLKRGTLFVLAAVGFAAFSSPAPQALAQTAGPYPGYRIGPKDLVRIEVYGVPELNVDRRVAENGTVNLPLVGDVEVSGLTAEELGRRLEEQLAKYLQRAATNVEVLGAPSTARARSASPAAGRCSRRSPRREGWRAATAARSSSSAPPPTASPTR